MTPRLDALHDQGVRTSFGRSPGRSRISHLDKNERACRLRLRNQAAVDSPRERNHVRPFSQRDLETLPLLEREHEIHTERLIRRAPDRANLFAEFINRRPRRGKRAERA